MVLCLTMGRRLSDRGESLSGDREMSYCLPYGLLTLRMG